LENFLSSDFDGDGFVDLLIASSGNIEIFFSEGHANFTSSKIVDTFSGSIVALKVADFGPNGYKDIVVATSESLFIIESLGSRNFRRKVFSFPKLFFVKMIEGSQDFFHSQKKRKEKKRKEKTIKQNKKKHILRMSRSILRR